MNDISAVCSDLKKVADEAMATFGGLSAEQLNWKPAEKRWSVAQCLDHLIVTHSLYFPLFEKLAVGDRQTTFWEKHSPLSGFFGRFLIKNLDPTNLKQMKTTSKASPSSSDIDGGIVDRFVEQQQQLIEHLQKLPDDTDAKETIITSPLMGFVTYSLDDTFTILAHHCKRHFDQARRLTETQGFPRS